MAEKAADFLKKEGPDKALAAFNKGDEWRDGDLYVFVIDKTGTGGPMRRGQMTLVRIGIWQA